MVVRFVQIGDSTKHCLSVKGGGSFWEGCTHNGKYSLGNTIERSVSLKWTVCPLKQIILRQQKVLYTMYDVSIHRKLFIILRICYNCPVYISDQIEFGGFKS
jgi:hypothetical protein